MPYQPIENYGVVGDLNTVALVSREASIDFMCFPDFDSPSLFGRMLDDDKGGHFKIAPTLTGMRTKQVYLPDTNILLSRFLSKDGVGEVSDFMPVDDRTVTFHAHRLVRRAKCVRGELTFRMCFSPAFDYARAGHTIDTKPDGVVFTSKGPDGTAVRLRLEAPVKIEDGSAIAEFTLSAGETMAVIMERASEGDDSEAAAPDYVSEAFKETMTYWHRWVRRSTYKGRWREMVKRSALTLKMLVSQRHGSLVAAPTFGLPEDLGGERNWDYRYTWIRDASFTIYALMRLGYTEEAAAFMKWIEDRTGELSKDGQLQIMYALDGHHELPETELEHLAGYRDSKPVRIGNGAYDQLQLDIYGELMDSVYIYNKHGQPISYDFWQNLVRMIDWVCNNWQRPDEGIWEVRGEPQEFLYSRLMCWVALDRGIRLADRRSFPAPRKRWMEVRDAIYEDIYEHFWNDKIKAFVQHKGSDAVDASSLLMPMVRFIGPSDPRWVSTMEAIDRELVEDSMVYRYKIDSAASDGLSGEEGTFTMCSFWYAECLARGGDLDRARYVLEKIMGYANHLGLFSEEIGREGELLGNFPQAFTHLALISAAFDLDRRITEAR